MRINNCPENFICINNLHITYISFILLIIIYFLKNIHFSQAYKNNESFNINQIENEIFKKQKKKKINLKKY